MWRVMTMDELWTHIDVPNDLKTVLSNQPFQQGDGVKYIRKLPQPTF